jgi:hypothetical protein
MSGWKRTVWTWIRRQENLLIAVQAFTIAGFLLPWRSREMPLILEILDKFADDTSFTTILLPVALTICVCAGLASMIILVSGSVRRGLGPIAIRMSSLLNCTMIAGPLIYIQPWRVDGTHLHDILDMVDYAGPGWTLTLVGGILAIIVTTRIDQIQGRAVEHIVPACDSPQRASIMRRKSLILTTTLLLIGEIAVITGFFGTWISGEMVSLWTSHDWSLVGVEQLGPITPAIVVAIVCPAMTFYAVITRRASARTYLLISEEVTMLALALVTFFWFTFKTRGLAIDIYFQNVALESGWYMCVSGLLLLLGTLLFLDMTTSRHDLSLRATRRETLARD